jgi:hypothetical protein
MFSSGPTTDPLSPVGANVPGFPVGEYDRAQNFVAQETHIFSPTSIGVARFSYLRNTFLLDEHLNHESPADLGFQYAPTLPSAAGPPFIQIGGYASVGDPITGPRNTFQNTFDLSGSLSWIHGRHELKFGGGYRRDQINALQGIASNGFFVFAAFPRSRTSSTTMDSPTSCPAIRWSFCRAAATLLVKSATGPWTLTARIPTRSKFSPDIQPGTSLRVAIPLHREHNEVNLFVPGAQSQCFPMLRRGFFIPAIRACRRADSNAENRFRSAIRCRLGPEGNSKTVVSAAYGIFYEPFYTGEGGPLQDPVSAPPYLKTQQISFPVNSFANPFYTPNPFGVPFPEPMTLLVVARNLHLPYAQDWNLNIQRSFGQDWLFQVGYVGTTGVRLPRFIEGNPPVFVPGADTTSPGCSPPNPCPISNENNVNQRRLYSGCTLASPKLHLQFGR